MTQLELRDSIQLVCDVNLIKAMTDNLPSANDLLITSVEAFEKYDYFPGSVILQETFENTSSRLETTDRVLVFIL